MIEIDRGILKCNTQKSYGMISIAFLELYKIMDMEVKNILILKQVHI